LVGTIVLLPILVAKYGKDLPALRKKLTPQVWAVTICIALLSGLAGTIFFTTALFKVDFIPFSVVMLLQKLQPLFAVITARIVLGEVVSPKFARWAVLSMIAAYFVTFPNGVVQLAAGSEPLIAALYAFGAAAAWGSSTAF